MAVSLGKVPGHVPELTILHRSDNYVIIDKPADVLMNGGRRDRQDDVCQKNVITVETLLKSTMPDLHDPSLYFGFRFVHRLDYSSSGVLCVALNKSAAAEAMRAFVARKTSKYYVALVSGHVSRCDRPAITRVDVGVGCDSRPDHTYRMCLKGEPHCNVNTVRSAVTEVLVLQKGFYGFSVSDNGQDAGGCNPSPSSTVTRRPASKLLLKAITGRRHQLRLHCRHLGHTIVGDYTYSDRMDTEPHRMFLHSLRLVLPMRTETLDVSTEDPFNSTAFWTPTETFHSLDDVRVYHQFDQPEPE